MCPNSLSYRVSCDPSETWKMVRKRDELCITVPALFRCPITLDVMKSPVSLCTGATYDRSSIQRWLDAGNNTCPATMQVLESKDLVPNHNLRRLIQAWSDSVKTRTSTAVNSDLIVQQLKSLIPVLVKGADDNLLPTHVNIFLEATSKLILLAKASDEYRSSDCEILVREMLCSFCKLPMPIQANVNVLHLLHMLLKNYRPGAIDVGLVPTLVDFLRHGCRELRLSAVKVVKYMAESQDECSRALVTDNEEACKEVLRLMDDCRGDEDAMDDCLACMLAISMPRKNRTRVVQCGAMAVLTEALNDGVKCVDKVLTLVEILSTCKEGRVEICRNEKCVQGIVKNVLKVSATATEHSVTILWSLCCLLRDPKAQEAVSRSNGMTKILLLIQSNVSPAVRQMCSDMLKVFKLQSRASCLSTYHTNTTHIMPF